MKEVELRKILSMVCEGYIDSIMVDVSEDKNINKKLPFTMACVNFICELKNLNIIVDLHTTFDNNIIDKINREISDYIYK